MTGKLKSSLTGGGGFVLALCVCLIAGFTFGFGAGLSPAEAECSKTSGCQNCYISSCGLLGEGEHYHWISWTWVERCTEYDHVDPHHCSIVRQDYWQVHDWLHQIMGDCFEHVCCWGTPQSEECVYAYTCP
jgi:hypothetical protein